MAGNDMDGTWAGPGRERAGYRYTPHYETAPQGDSRAQEAGSAHAAAQDAQAPSGLSAWVGAVGSIALVVGLAVWGHALATRDVADVPVIRALDGAAYIASPTDDLPGASRPTLSLDTLKDGTPPPIEDTVRVAPEPVDIDPPDLPEARSASTMGPVSDAPAEGPKVTAVLDDLIGDTPPLSTFPGDEVIDATPQVELLPDPSLAGGMPRSPRPVGRPDGLANRTPVAVVPQTEQAAFRDPGQLPAGTIMVQFSAATSRAGAEADWDRLSRDYATYLRGKAPVIQTAMVGGQRYHRLRVVNFANARDARQFCSVFMAQGQQCFLTTLN